MSELNSHVCFDALATLQNIQNIEHCCNFCGGSHTIQDCPELSKGEHIFDNCLQDLSRSSVPSGLHVIEHNVPCVITSQKFAKGSRFGPLLAKKSYIPIENLRFPLIIFGNIIPDLNIPELEELFKVRNVYLDTTNENECNWMVHVNPAEYLNEQNLIAYQEDNQIYFTAIHDIEVGDILKVWYAPSYAAKMCIPLLQPSQYEIVNNILRQVSIDHSSLKVEPDDESFNCEPVYYNNVHHSTDVSLPPIQSIFTAQGTFPKTEYLTPDLHTYNNHLDIAYDPATIHTDVLDISMTNSDVHESFNTTPTHSTEFNNNIEMKPLDGDEPAGAEAKIKKDTQSKKKNYQCQFCDKSYATMTNIYKHMRTHDLYLCSLCMKTFREESEIKQHNCGTTGIKKPQCMVCFKYLSNAWSLTRHMKIHPKMRGNECNKNPAIPSLEAELFEQNSLLSDDLTNELGSIMESADDDYSNPKVNKRFQCIVCLKKFKNYELLQKHLKDVHTVKTFKIKKSTAGMDSETTTSSPNKSGNVDTNSHSSLPVKQSIAMALASKLNKKNTTSHSGNDVELPRLIPIASEPTGDPFREQFISESLHPVLTSLDGDHFMPNSDLLLDTSNIVEDVEESILASAVPRPNVKHQCNVCNKMFNKTNQLKRHKETHENIIYICPFCDNKSVKTKKTILKHLKTSHPEHQSDAWNSTDFINSLAMRNYTDLNAAPATTTTTKSKPLDHSPLSIDDQQNDSGMSPPQIKYEDDHLLNNKINLNNATNKLERSNKLSNKLVNECDSKSAKDSKLNLVLSKKNNIELMKDIYHAKNTNFVNHDDISKNHHFGDRNIVDGQFMISNCNSETTSKLTKIGIS